MQDLINLGKKVAIAGGKEAMKYFRKPNLDFDNKSQTHFDPVSKADRNTENIMKNLSVNVMVLVAREKRVEELNVLAKKKNMNPSWRS